MEQLGNKGGVAENQAALARVSVEEGNLSDAEAGLKKSLAEFEVEKTTLNEIPAEVDLSRVLLREGNVTGARRTISNALALSGSSRDPNLKLPVVIEDARIEAAELASRSKSKPEVTMPLRKLQDVILTAHRLGYYEIECDARLALAELESRAKPELARAHLTVLAEQAHSHGLNLVARKARTMAISYSPAVKTTSDR
jgi:hypothetical protein